MLVLGLIVVTGTAVVLASSLDVPSRIYSGEEIVYLKDRPAFRRMEIAPTAEYSFRIAAKNDKGYGALSEVESIGINTGGILPDAPRSIFLGGAYASNKLKLYFQPPWNDGGNAISKSLIECDSLASFDSSSSDYWRDEITLRREVQEIKLACGNKCFGTFRLSWGGKLSLPLDVGTNTDDIATEISVLVGTNTNGNHDIKVTRTDLGSGIKWTVTFGGVDGNIGEMDVDANMIVGYDPNMSVQEVFPGFVDIYPGSFTHELQSVTIRRKDGYTSPINGDFTLSFEGAETNVIDVDTTAMEMKEILENLDTIKNVYVVKRVGDDQVCWLVEFTDLGHEENPGAGDLEMLRLQSSTFVEPSSIVMDIFENRRGSNPMQYTLSEATTGKPIYCRASSYNSAGFGMPSRVVMATVGAKPRQPEMVYTSINDSSLDISWEKSTHNTEAEIGGYLVEWFSGDAVHEIQQITTSASGGVAEIQVIRASAEEDSLGGYFTLSFGGEETRPIAYNAQADGPDSVKMNLRRLSTIGDVHVNRKLSTIAIKDEMFNLSSGTNILSRYGSSDLTKIFESGEMIFIDGEIFVIDTVQQSFVTIVETYNGPTFDGAIICKWAHGYEWEVTFLSNLGNLELLDAIPGDNWSGVNPSISVKRLVDGRVPLSGTFELSLWGKKTAALPHNADATYVEEVLKALKEIGNVDVSVYPNSNGRNYIITFSSVLGNVPLMEIDFSNLHGSSASAKVSTIQDGLEPNLYGRQLVNFPSATSAILDNLTNGVPYTIYVSAYNDRGRGGNAFAVPSPMTPMGKPSAPTNVKVEAMSNSMIKIIWQASVNAGGAESISTYLVQWNISPDFPINSTEFQRELHVSSSMGNQIYCMNISIDPSSSSLPRYARVFAFNGYKWSLPQNALPPFAIPQYKSPGPVEDTIAFATSSNGIMSEWKSPSAEHCEYGGNGGSEISHYVLEWDIESDFSSSSSVVVSPESRSYHIGGRDSTSGAESLTLLVGGTYYLRIIAFNGIGPGTSTPFFSRDTNSKPIGPLRDTVPSIPTLRSGPSLTSTSMFLEWDSPNLDGGSTIQSYTIEHSSNPNFDHFESMTLPVIREVQQISVTSEVVAPEVQSVQVTVEVANEIQSVRTTVSGLDEIQTVTTTCDDVVAEVQTVSLNAVDNNEEQTLTLDADDVDEIQLVRVSGNDIPEIQGVTVSVVRAHEVQKLGIILSFVNTNGADHNDLACNGVLIGEPCEEIEDSLSGSFTVSFNFDKCGGDDAANYCQAALTKYEPGLGIISCSPSFVSNPMLGGDHCVSEPIVPSFSATEGDTGTLQWALNSMLDDNGKAFMTSNNVPTKNTAVTVTREGRVKTKATCPFDADGIAECAGEYEIDYSITFDSDHSSGDVSPLTIIHSDLKIDTSSATYMGNVCPLSIYPNGCSIPQGTALDSFHGNFYENSAHDEAVEMIKGSQPTGLASLFYECESKVTKLLGGHSMTSSIDGLEVSFDDLSFLSNAVEGQWFRFSDDNSLDIYRRISQVDLVSGKLLLEEAVESLVTSNDAEYGHYYSGWDESNTSSGVSHVCQTLRTHQALPINVEVNFDNISTSDWKLKLGALPPIDSTGLEVTRHLVNDLSSNVGFMWIITFGKQPGLLNTMSCDAVDINVSCSVQVLQQGSIIDGSFTLGTTWPHEYVAESPTAYLSNSLQWNMNDVHMKEKLEAITEGDNSVFGAVDITRTVYVAPGHMRWSGGYTWTITFKTRPGNVPALIANPSGLTGSGISLQVSDEDSGDHDTYRGLTNNMSFIDDPGTARDGNQVSGSFALSWVGNSHHNQIVTSDVFPVQMGGAGAKRFMALSSIALDSLLSQYIFSGNNGQIAVTRSSSPSQAMGFKYTIEFVHEDLGGDLPALSHVQSSQLYGVNANVEIFEQTNGNEIRGTFQLKFKGQTTRPINYDATAIDVESAINDLSTISPSAVSVSRTFEPVRIGPSSGIGGYSSQVGGHVWTITFLSNVWKDPTLSRDLGDIPGNWFGTATDKYDTWDSGFSKGWGKNVGNMPEIECISSGLTTTNSAFPSDGCIVIELVKGSNPLDGHFKLCLDTRLAAYSDGVISIKDNLCTDYIRHNAPASALESNVDGSSVEEKLEALNNIGDVSVGRGPVNEKNGGYTWTIQFLNDADGPCQQTDSFVQKCNAPGNVPKLCIGGNQGVCEDSSLTGTCNKPGSCSRLTVLDAADYTSGVRPPSAIERQKIVIKDTNYHGWEDGTVVDKIGVIAEYKLRVGDSLTNCLPHNAPAIDIKNELQAILDVDFVGGTLLVEIVKSETNAPNGFLYYVSFYDTGNLPIMIPYFSSDSSVCTNGFGVGQSVEVESILDGSPHSASCESCADGVVQRGNLDTFEVFSDTLSGHLPWNADALQVKAHLEQVEGRHVEVEMSVLDKFGSCEWIISFIGNPNSLPPGAQDVQPLNVNQGNDSAGQSGAVLVTELRKGSDGLGGTFTLDYGSPFGPIILDYDEPADRLQMKLNELNVVGNVFVTRDCFPSCTTGGWGNMPIHDADVEGGFIWYIHFLDNPGTTQGRAFPPGSGNVDLPSLKYDQLSGNQASSAALTISNGSPPLEGDFQLQLNGEVTDLIPFNADKEKIEHSLSNLENSGIVSVISGHIHSQKIIGISASATLDGTMLTLQGDDIRKFLLPGDEFQVVCDSCSTSAQSIGQSKVETGSPIISDVAELTSSMFVGEKVSIHGDEYSVVRNGAEIQLLTIHSGVIGGQDFSYTLTVSINNVANTTPCIPFGSPSTYIEDAMNGLPNVGIDGVKVSFLKDSVGTIEDPHTMKVYFLGNLVLGDVGETTTGVCADISKNAVPYSAVRTIIHGGNVEHQRIILSADSGTMESVPTFSLTFTSGTMEIITTPCMEWGTRNMKLYETLNGAFGEDAFTVGSGGIVSIGLNSYVIEASDFVGGNVLIDDELQVENSCICKVIRIGTDGKTITVTALASCSGFPGSKVLMLPDTKIIEEFSQRIPPKPAVTRMHLSSQVSISDSRGTFKLEFSLRGEIHHTQCLPYGISANAMQSELNGIFDFNGDGVIDHNDVNHVLVRRRGDGSVRSGYGYTYTFESTGSKSVAGVSNVLGTFSPKVKVLGLGSTVGCVNVGVIEKVVTSSGTTTHQSISIENIDVTQYPLRAGSRIKIDGSSVDKMYTVSRVHQTSSTIELLEPFQGLSQANSASILEIIGSTPHISIEIVTDGSNEYEYDIYFIGSYWHDVPLVAINRFGDGTCEGDAGYAIGGMNRNMDVSTIQNGGGMINSIQYAFDTSVRISGRSEITMIPPIFTVREESSLILNVVSKDDDNESLWSSGRPSFKIIKNSIGTKCIYYDSSERDFEEALSIFCSDPQDPCATVTRSQNASNAPNGFVHTIYFQGIAGIFPFTIDTADPECDAFDTVSGEQGLLEYVQKATNPRTKMDANKLHLGLSSDSSKAARWPNNSQVALSLLKISGTRWTIRFDNYLGDVPSLTGISHLHSLNSKVSTKDNFVSGSNPKSGVISSLQTGLSSFARIYASNGIGRSNYSGIVSAIPGSSPPAIKYASAHHALYTNEVQSISIVATHINEVQRVATNAIPIPEVQELIVRGDVVGGTHQGSFSLRFPQEQVVTFTSGSTVTGGSFYLELVYIDLEASITKNDGTFVTQSLKTPCIPFGASAQLVKQYLEEDALSNPLGKGSVETSRSGDGSFSSSFGYEYQIKFVGGNVRGYMRQLTTDFTLAGFDAMGGLTCTSFDSLTNDAMVQIVVLNEGKTMGTDTSRAQIAIMADEIVETGQFLISVTHLGRTLETECLAWNVEPSLISDALQDLTNVDSVQVHRRGNGSLSNSDGAIKDKIVGTAFVVGETLDSIEVQGGGMPIAINEILRLGDRLQLSSQKGNKFYTIISVDTLRAKLDDIVEIDSEPFEVTTHSNYEYMIYFDGQGMHANNDGESSFKPSVHVSVSTGSCDPFQTFIDNVLKVTSNLKTRVFIKYSNDGGDTLTSGYDESSDLIGSNLMQAVPFLTSIVSTVESIMSGEGIITYTMTFGSDNGDLDELVCNSNSDFSLWNGHCQVNTIMDGNVISGNFYLGTSEAISHNASAEDMELALASIPGISDVVVSRNNLSHQGSYEWMITYIGKPGNCDELSVSNSLSGKNVSVSLTEYRRGNEVEGSFQLLYGETISGPILYDVDAQALKLAIEKMEVFDTVLVNESNTNPEAGKTFHVTFVDHNLGDINLLQSTTNDLVGVGASVSIREEVKGSLDTPNSIHVSFLPPTGCSQSQVQNGSCGNAITAIEAEIHSSADDIDNVQTKTLLSDRTIQLIKIHSSPSSASATHRPLSGTFRLSYNGMGTSELPYNCNAMEMRNQIESFPDIETVSASRDYSSKFLDDVCVNIEIGSSVVQCSDLCSCNFATLGLTGNDLVDLGGKWFRVSSSYDGEQNEFQLSNVLNSLNLVVYEGSESLQNFPIKVGTGGYEWTITFHAWKRELQMLTSPTHNLYPVESTIHIDLQDCIKCLVYHNLHEWSNYVVRLRTQNEFGWSEYTEPVPVMTKSLPNAPTDVTVTVLSGTCIQVSIPPLNTIAGLEAEDISSFVVEWDTYSDFRSNRPPREIESCSSPSNGHCEFQPGGETLPIQYEVCHLLSSIQYFFRMASKNSVKVQSIYSPGGQMENFRWSATHSIIAQDQAPDPPTIFSTVPLGQHMIQILIQPPLWDGGQPISSYFVEWDDSQNFASAQTLEIGVDDLRSLENSALLVYNLQPSVPQLSSWKVYNIRLKVSNIVGSSETTAPVSITLKSPPKPPKKGLLSTASHSTEPITSATVSWDQPLSILPNEYIHGYIVEWWTTDKSPEIQIVKLQYTSTLENTIFSLSFSTSPTLKRGTSMMPWDASESLVRRELMNLGWEESNDNRMIDNIQVSKSLQTSGHYWTITFGQNEHGLNYGDVVTLSGQVSSNGDTGLPKLSISTVKDGQRPHGQAEIQILQIYGTGDLFGCYRLSFGNENMSTYITSNATAQDIEVALEQLLLIRDVDVSQKDDIDQSLVGTSGDLIHYYEITFVSNVGNVNALTVEASTLQTSNNDVSVVVTDGDNELDSGGLKMTSSIIGEKPVGYKTSVLLHPSTTKYNIAGLATGKEYVVAISAMNNDHGFSERMLPTPSSIVPPKQIPQMPQNMNLAVNPGVSDSLLITYDAPSSDGGDTISRYRIELDPTSSFDNPIVQDVICPEHNKRTVWKVETKSINGGIIDGGSFSLLLSANGMSGASDEIPYNAVALAQNETGTTDWFNTTDFMVSTGSPSILTSPPLSLEGRVFVGDRVSFTDQIERYKLYRVSVVLGSTLTLSEVYSGVDGPQKMARHYGGRGDPSSSRVYCEYEENLCDINTVRQSGSMEKKIQMRTDIVKGEIFVDRDGPSVSNEFIWRITFMDNPLPSDFEVKVNTESLTTVDNIGTASVVTTLMIVGERYNTCVGTHVVPTYGGLIKGLQYHSRVAAINTVGYSSIEKSVSPQAPMVVPGPPTSVSLNVVSDMELRIMFASPVDNGGDAITKYLIEWDTSNMFENPESSTVEYLDGGSPFFKTIGGLTMGEFKYFRVKAWNSQGYGSPQNSSPSSLNPHEPPAQPSNVRLGVTSESMLTVGWTIPLSNGGDKIKTYRVEWDTRATFTSSNSPPHKGYVDVDADNVSSYTINLLSPKKVYFVRIFAFNNAGSGEPGVSDPLYASPSNQVPGKVMSLRVHQSSSNGSLDIHWQRPLIPHHEIPCSGTNDNVLECPTRFGGSIQSSDGGEEIVEYEVEFNERDDFSGSDGGRKIVYGTFTTINHLTTGRMYFIRVLARNIIGSGAYTVEQISATAP